ncbi:MAG: DUF2267 domain-containing protein [Actinomycetota bacterium]|nr:DUF2267 domain-containing protein [Actinomycetota bacterium]
MKFDQFVKEVRTRAGLDSTEHAEKAARATLSVLGERLAGGEPGDLASQLPPEIADALGPQSPGESFDVDEFYRRVADSEGTGCTPGQAREHAMAVMSTVVDTVTPGQRDDVASQLPAGYAELLR